MDLPIKYLGLPLGDKYKDVGDLEPDVGKVWKEV